MRYVALSAVAAVGFSCATPQLAKLEGSVLNVPGQCLEYDAFDDDQHPDCREILGRGRDHSQELEDFLADVHVGEEPSPIPLPKGESPYGSLSQIPHVLITPPNEWNQGCYDKSLAANPNLMSDECGYHAGVSEEDVDGLLLPLLDTRYKGPVITIEAAGAVTATVSEGAAPEDKELLEYTGDGINFRAGDFD